MDESSTRPTVWTSRPVLKSLETSAMPTDYCLTLQDRQGVQYFGSQAIKSEKHKAIDTAESHPLRRSTAQYIELVAKNKDFSLQCRPRPE